MQLVLAAASDLGVDPEVMFHALIRCSGRMDVAAEFIRAGGGCSGASIAASVWSHKDDKLLLQGVAEGGAMVANSQPSHSQQQQQQQQQLATPALTAVLSAQVDSLVARKSVDEVIHRMNWYDTEYPQMLMHLLTLQHPQA